MPRKKKLEFSDENTILKNSYVDACTVKNVSINIIRHVSKTINYENKEEVFNLLPLMQKQMDIIEQSNQTILTILDKLNESNEPEPADE